MTVQASAPGSTPQSRLGQLSSVHLDWGTGEVTTLLQAADWHMLIKALLLGRHFDCATAYSNHEAIGKVLAKKVGKDKERSRDSVWITTKLFNGDHESAKVGSCKIRRITCAEVQTPVISL